MHHKCTHTLLSKIIITNDYNYQLFNQLATYGNKERCNNSKPKLGINFVRNSKFKSLWGSLWLQHALWALLQKISIHLVFYLMGLSPCVSLSTLKWHKNWQYTSLILIFLNMFSSILYGILKMLHEYKEWSIFQNLCQKNMNGKLLVLFEARSVGGK